MPCTLLMLEFSWAGHLAAVREEQTVGYQTTRQGSSTDLVIVAQVQQMDYSCIVFDTAPTGHTLRLLQFPATLQKGLSKLMGLRGMLGGMLGQITQLLGGPAGGASNQLFDRLEEMQARVEQTCEGARLQDRMMHAQADEIYSMLSAWSMSISICAKPQH